MLSRLVHSVGTVYQNLQPTQRMQLSFFLVTVANQPMPNHITNLSWSVPFSNLWFVLNSQYFLKWTNVNPVKMFGQLASHPKLLIGSKLSLGYQEIKFPSKFPLMGFALIHFQKYWLLKFIFSTEIDKIFTVDLTFTT